MVRATLYFGVNTNRESETNRVLKWLRAFSIPRDEAIGDGLVKGVEELRFSSSTLQKPVAGPLAVETTLQHFVIVTYLVDPFVLKMHLHPRFEPVSLTLGGKSRALVSVVTFFDHDFRFVAVPRFTASFGQTNYRAYVTDTKTGEHVAWFFGTSLDSVSVVVPKYLWKLPWHRARMKFTCKYDPIARRYAQFDVSTKSAWAPARLAIEDSGEKPDHLPGFSSLEAGMVLLTNPMHGFFFRSDGALGSYSIWHDRAQLTVGSVRLASYPLLARLNLVEAGDQGNIHSVLLQPSIDFTIYLPPRKAASR